MPLTDVHKSWYAEFGPLTRMHGFNGMEDIVAAFDPKDFETVYRTEGIWPTRKTLETFLYYRQKIRPDIFAENNRGLLNEQGENWHNIRTKVNPVMMQPRTVKQYVAPVEDVVDDFIKRTISLLDANNELPANYLNELNRWALESIARIALDTRLGCLENNLQPNSEPQKMIDGIHTFFNLTFQLGLLPSMWRIYATKPFKQLMGAFDVLTFISMKYVDEAIKRMKDNPGVESERELSVLEKLLKIDRDVAIVMALDMMMAGVDTTSSVAACLLYHLAKNPDAQEKLRSELIAILPEKDSKLSQDSFNSTPYFRACAKEAHRLTPVAGVNPRRAGQDIVLSGYRIPKGTYILMSHILPSLLEEQFPRSKEFIPERWMVKSKEESPECPNAKTAHPFAYMPFGFGPRICIGKRFADLEVQTLVSKLLRNHRIEWNHGEFEIDSKILNTPKSPLRFKITKID